MHTIAAISARRPAANDKRRHVQAQCVVPTAPDHHVRSPAIITAPRDGASHPQQTADEGEHEAFGRKQSAHARGAEAHGAKQADFARALFDTEPEEQGGEHQRGDDEEKAEVGEVFAEVSGAARRGQPVRAHVADGEAEGERVDSGAKTCRVPIARFSQRHAGRGHDPDGRPVAETRAPDLLAHLERDEGLGRGAAPVPVVFVNAANAREVERKRRIPVAERFRAGDARVDRREVAVGGRAAIGTIADSLKSALRVTRRPDPPTRNTRASPDRRPSRPGRERSNR